MRKSVRLIITSLFGLLLTAGVLTACSSQPSGISMSAPGPVYNGIQYCGYNIVPDECSSSGVPNAYWVQMPATMPYGYNQYSTTQSDIAAMMFMWHLQYYAWYSSPAYYNHYVPAGSRNTYITNVQHFDSTYSSQENTRKSQATYKQGNKTVSGDKLNTSKLKAPSNNGGSGQKKTSGKPCAAGVMDSVSIFGRSGSAPKPPARSSNKGGNRTAKPTKKGGC